MDYHVTTTSVRPLIPSRISKHTFQPLQPYISTIHFDHYTINTIAYIKTYISTSLSLNNNLNIDSQPLKIPPEEDCKVETCRGLTKDNTDKDATFLPFFLLKSTTPTTASDGRITLDPFQ